MDPRSTLPIWTGALSILFALACGCPGSCFGSAEMLYLSPAFLPEVQAQVARQAEELDAQAGVAPSEQQRDALRMQADAFRWFANLDETRDDVARAFRAVRLHGMVSAAAHILATLMLLVAGAGLLFRMRWARHLGNAAVGLTLLALTALAFLSLFHMGPAVSPLVADLMQNVTPPGGSTPTPDPATMGQTVGAAGCAFSLCPAVLGPLVLLVLLNLPGTRTGCQPPPAPGLLDPLAPT